MRTSRIGIRELRQELSRALQRVRKGQILEVTDRGHPVARIVPIVAAAERLNELIADGTVRPPRSSGALPPPLDLPSRMTSEEAIDLLRGR